MDTIIVGRRWVCALRVELESVGMGGTGYEADQGQEREQKELVLAGAAPAVLSPPNAHLPPCFSIGSCCELCPGLPRCLCTDQDREMIHTARQAAVQRMETVITVRRSGVQEAQWMPRVQAWSCSKERGNGARAGRARGSSQKTRPAPTAFSLYRRPIGFTLSR